MCKECFLQYATHKFRSTLGKSKLVKANDKVLLAVSGGHTSRAMVHLVTEALSEKAHKRLRFSPGIVFIDESFTLKNDIEKETLKFQEEMKNHGYPFYTVPVYQNSAGKDEFLKNFQTVSTLTAKTDYIEKLRLRLIVETAVQHGYNKIMLGENATTLSMKLLSNISQGRGISLPKDVAVGDDRYPDVMVVRPMRELSSKEVVMYNRFEDLPSLILPNLHTMAETGASLQRQTEEFINGLQVEFPSTVSTVFRTGDKLCSNASYDNNNEKCAFCQGTISKEKMEFNEPVDVSCGKKGGCCGSSDECSSNKFKLNTDDIKANLCYGCNLTFKDMNLNVASFPLQTLETISTNIKRAKMKETIQDFLLE